MKINEHLKFSWGHIIAFVALIFIGYISFLGLTYLTDGDFFLVGLSVFAIVAILLALFMGIQVLKATDHRFKKRIVIERLLVTLSPFVIVSVLFPFCHFWNVYDNRRSIENNFSKTITNARQLFVQYDDYSQDRIKALEESQRGSRFSSIRKKNQIEALTIQLQGDNYQNLKEASFDWISGASKATVWNVFMIGNIHTITDAFTSWNQSLVDFSDKQLSFESHVVKFDAEGENVNQVSKGFSAIKKSYSETSLPNWYSWLWICFLYFCLMLPYIIQQRHTKSTRFLFYNETKHHSSSLDLDDSKEIEKDDVSTVPDVTMDEETEPIKSKAQSKKIVDDDDDYGSFTM